MVYIIGAKETTRRKMKCGAFAPKMESKHTETAVSKDRAIACKGQIDMIVPSHQHPLLLYLALRMSLSIVGRVIIKNKSVYCIVAIISLKGSDDVVVLFIASIV